MTDKTFGGCNVDLESEALERKQERPNDSPLPTSPEVEEGEKVRTQCRETIEEGRGIF